MMWRPKQEKLDRCSGEAGQQGLGQRDDAYHSALPGLGMTLEGP
jgi:hypothetical protein